jgi:NADH-quinone oxidoreductase subunit K
LSLILALYQKSKSLDIEFWTELREPDLPPPMLAEDEGKPPFVRKPPMRFPRLTPAGAVPEHLDTHDPILVDDVASQTADTPLEPPQPKEVIKSVTR